VKGSFFVRIVLIGGTSHAGKSTMAETLAAQLSWRCLSTDSLAKHPGRPWRDAPNVLPPHVVEHYRDLPLSELMQSVLHHYDSMWVAHILPLIRNESGLVMEGSALLPGRIAPILSDDVQAVWLVASDSVIERRIKSESGYPSRDADSRFLIDKFAARAVAFNHFIASEVHRLNLRKVYIDSDSEIDDVCSQVMNGLQASS
jgi:shikimate kinase